MSILYRRKTDLAAETIDVYERNGARSDRRYLLAHFGGCIQETKWRSAFILADQTLDKKGVGYGNGSLARGQ